MKNKVNFAVDGVLTFVISVGALGAGFALAKRHYAPKSPLLAEDPAVEQERKRTIEIAKNAYILGCLQSFERVCSLLRKEESFRCVKYSKAYCEDAASDYATKLRAIIKGPN